jgi:hypothetical protein
VRYKVSRATSPIDGRINLVVIDENFSLHPEASSYLLVLADGRKRSINTVRAYAGRVARFLGWADRHGVVWKTITLTEMTLYRRWLEETPEGAEEPPRGVDRRLLKLPKASTISGHLTATCGFLRFCAQQGIVEERVAAQLAEERILPLVRARRQVSAQKRQSVLDAIRDMRAGGVRISFAAVARHARVSEGLVHDPALKKCIAEAIAEQQESGVDPEASRVPARSRVTTDSLRQDLVRQPPFVIMVGVRG